ncbi:Meckelin, partial [Clarias magur]
MCYNCDVNDCLGTMRCEGDEDYCITASAELLRCYSCDPTKCDQIEPQTCSAGMDSCITAT